MLKNIIFKRILLTTCVLITILLIYLVPKKDNELSLKQELIYTSLDIKTHDIFLLDSDNYVAMTKVLMEEEDTVSIAKELLNILIIDGLSESKIPSGFKSLIPSDTIINKITFDENILKIDFSKDIFDTKKEMEEKILESIIYSLTSINGVNKIMIFIDGTLLSKLPSSNNILPSVLDRSYGINKKYDFMSLNDIESLTIYYINEYNGDYYYVPVTSYINDSREKISIIIDELSNSNLYTTNLMSFLSSNTKLLAVDKIDDTIKLEFNDAIFSNIEEKSILEEVIYTISLSVFDNYSVKELVFLNNNEEIYKKTIES